MLSFTVVASGGCVTDSPERQRALSAGRQLLDDPPCWQRFQRLMSNDSTTPISSTGPLDSLLHRAAAPDADVKTAAVPLDAVAVVASAGADAEQRECSPMKAACMNPNQIPEPTLHIYDVLCVGGLQGYAADALQEVAAHHSPGARIEAVSWGDGQVPAGKRKSGVGKAGLSRVRMTSGALLPTELVNSPCGYCTLVHVCEGSIGPDAHSMTEVAAAITAAPRWPEILHTLQGHALRPLEQTFRTTTVRGGDS